MKVSLIVILLYLVSHNTFSQDKELPKDTNSVRYGDIYIGIQTRILTSDKFKTIYQTKTYNAITIGTNLGKKQGKTFFAIGLGIINLDSLGNNLKISCNNFSFGYLRQGSITKNVDMRIQFGLNILDNRGEKGKNHVSVGSLTTIGIAIKNSEKTHPYAFFDIGFNQQKQNSAFYKDFSSWMIVAGIAL